MYQPRKRESKIVLTLGLPALFLCASPAWAEFTLNWTADNPTPVFSGTTIYHSDVFEGGTIPQFEQTPFIYERVMDGTTPYYHMIVGDPASGFAQEVYIQTGFNGGPVNQPLCAGPVNCGGVIPASGRLNPTEHSASDGETWSFDGFTLALGSGSDPLGTDATFTGNSSGNPTRVQMRQLVTDGDLTVDFVKDKYLEKPSITNIIDAADLNATVIIDSTGNPLNSAATASVVTNTTELKGSNLPPDISSPNGGPSAVRFDMATDAQNPHVTAGQYFYTPGSSDKGSSGTYTYSEGGANINPDWSSYFDHSETNPWAFPDNRPTP